MAHFSSILQLSRLEGLLTDSAISASQGLGREDAAGQADGVYVGVVVNR